MDFFPWRKPRVPVIELHGIIASKAGSINIGAYTGVIDRAFAAAKKDKKIILAIESPGGSPVQSDLIGQLIRRRAAETGVEVSAVIGDVGASGGYWLACAADKIYANRLSIVGSIGVITGGFGFDKFIARHDIDRRLRTAGENKARNEPFTPERPQDVAFTQELLDQVHGMFKAWVRERRGSRLPADENLVFDGGYMLGKTARDRGLIDGYSDIDELVKTLGGEEAKAAWFKPKRPRGLMRLLTRSAVSAALEIAEERTLSLTLR